MNAYFTVPGTDNVVDMKAYRTWKECYKLYSGYKTKVSQMMPDQVAEERCKLNTEMEKFPNHLLTKVKAMIFENATGTKI